MAGLSFAMVGWAGGEPWVITVGLVFAAAELGMFVAKEQGAI